MMFALGCIQSRRCNTDHCPTGIATQNPARFKSLDVEHKSVRVANYHASVIKHLIELLAVAGLERLDQLEPIHINHRVNGTNVKTYKELYPTIPANCLLSESTIPASWQDGWEQAAASSW
jgi:hypothetical protein